MKLYNQAEAADYLMIAEGTLLNLRRRHKIGFIKGRPARYLERHLIDYLLSQEVSCAESQSLSNSKTNQEILSPLIGTSNSTMEEVNASLLGSELARKTMKLTSRSQHSR